MKKKTILALTFISGLAVLLTACGENNDHSESREFTKEVAEATEGEESGDVPYDLAIQEEEMPESSFNTESYAYIKENDFKNPKASPLSTFSTDVDNASYTNVRRMLNYGEIPPVDAVRIEEFINYFDYNYPSGNAQEPFSIYTELGDCPWNKSNKLLHIGIKGYSIPTEKLPPSNLVFLIDVSGSMSDPNKLPLLKKSLIAMTQKLGHKDRVAIVTYAGNSGVALNSTGCGNKYMIVNVLENLESGGSTAGSEGLELAYQMAEKHFMKDGNNRIILATDGDFNVGPGSDAEMQRLIESKRDLGIYITVLGFGMGNYKDSKMEVIADHGNGNYFYIDDIREVRHTLVDNLAGTLVAIAKDVKFQVEFNPETVQSYRLIGYENRLMDSQDFNDDTKDAGEIGAGHTVTAIYEIIPGEAGNTDELRYQTQRNDTGSGDLAYVKVRYKKPESDKSELITKTVVNQTESTLSENFKFSAAVAAFGMKLRGSTYLNNMSWTEITQLAVSSKGNDPEGLRGELIQLVKTAEMLKIPS